MNKNRIIILITVVLLAATAALFLTRRSTTLKKSVSEFAVRDTASIVRIFMADKFNNEVVLERAAGGWTVNGDRPAQQAKIDFFLKTLMDLEVRSPVALAARDNVIRRMAVNARKIEIYQVKPWISLFGRFDLFTRERLARTYYVGDVTQDNLGTYMLMDGTDEPYVVHIPGFRGFVSTRYSTKVSDWRDYTVFRNKIGDIRSVKMEFPDEPGQSYLMEVQDNRNVSLFALGESRLVEGFDTLKVVGFLASFEDVRFESMLEGLIEPAFIDSVKASQPRTIITLTDRTGTVNEVKIFRKKGFSGLYNQDGMAMEPMDLDRAYALVNDGEDFVLIQYYTFDRVTRPLGYFLNR